MPGISVNGKRDEKDKRNKLVDSYVSFVELVKPKLLFFENVRGFTMEFVKNGSGTVYSDQVTRRLKNLGYEVHAQVVNFADYGIPQRRCRFILVGSLGGKAKEFFEQLGEKKAEFRDKRACDHDAPFHRRFPTWSGSTATLTVQMPNDFALAFTLAQKTNIRN